MRKIARKIARILIATLLAGTLAPSLPHTSEKAEAASFFNSEKDIISRDAWDADEDYLFLEHNTSTPDLIELSDDFAEKYADELVIERTVTHDSQGRQFKWPLSYPENVTKFIVHHTETTSNLDNPPLAIRNIYYYHAISRGWGDIGYNYIIDTNGRVYEGRYGGEGVVGGHAGPGNTGSIGISILGSYDDDEVPEAALSSLAKLIAIKSKIHDIDPTGYSSFRGEVRANIMGHRDIMNTDCPGDYLYGNLPMIASMAKSMMNEDKPKYVKSYDYIDKSDVFYVEMDPEETEKVTIEFQNIGTTTWNKNTYLVANKNPEHDEVIDFPSKEGIKLAEMEESEVEPGETATFEFTIHSKKKSDLIFLDLAPVINGAKKISEYKTLPVKTNAPVFTYELKDYDELPTAMQKGEQFTGEIKLKNTGNITWKQYGKNKVYITDNNVMIGEMKEYSVSEGGTATFEFTYTASENSGFYEGELDVILKGEGDLVGEEMPYELVVYREGLVGELLGTSQSNEFKQGKSYVIWAKLRNIGSEVWNSDDITVGYIKDQYVEVKDTGFSQKVVEPGEEIEIDILIEIADNSPIRKNVPFVIAPKINGKRFADRRISLYYDVVKTTSVKQQITVSKSEMYAYDAENVTVSDKALAEDEGGDVRVRISFNEAPVITSDDTFYLYNDGEKVKTLDAGDTVTLDKVGLKYKAKLSTESTLLMELEPFQVRAKNDKALEITNFSRVSAWNSSYNDNEFRGAIELQLVDGEYAVINELSLEDYLKGLAEEPNSEAFEKIKAIMVAARSYAKFYMHYAEKFPGKPYDLNDDPAYCQKYLGYGYETRAPNVAKAVEETEGEVVTHFGQLIKTPYFSSDDGQTKSALEVWNWNAPYLISVDDPYCDGNQMSGHGVGMSGCGARGMAEAGYNYEEILEYYYTDTQVTKLW